MAQSKLPNKTMTTLTIFVAWFAFGYSVTDIIMNIRSERRINQFIKDLDND